MEKIYTFASSLTQKHKNMIEQKIEGEFLVIRIPLAELPRVSTTFQPMSADPLKGLKTKTRDFLRDLQSTFQHNVEIGTKGAIKEICYSHRVNMNVALKELEKRGFVSVNRAESGRILTFTIL